MMPAAYRARAGRRAFVSAGRTTAVLQLLPPPIPLRIDDDGSTTLFHVGPHPLPRVVSVAACPLLRRRKMLGTRMRQIVRRLPGAPGVVVARRVILLRRARWGRYSAAVVVSVETLLAARVLFLFRCNALLLFAVAPRRASITRRRMHRRGRILVRLVFVHISPVVVTPSRRAGRLLWVSGTCSRWRVIAAGDDRSASASKLVCAMGMALSGRVSSSFDVVVVSVTSTTR
mmetsp:Transcript_26755/g.67422  ORF Transcript_26755/g.67422 Transcript_26755/m.67422 type:complete len:230 (-) Transcript_26755:4127-4816(-)